MQMLWLSRKDIEDISRRLLRDYLKKVPQKVDHIDPADFAEKMCGLQFTFADISEAHDAIGLTATSGVIITIPQRDGTRLDYELDGKTAFINQSLVAENQIGRLNFTMMHEAAHQLFWMLYPEEYEAQTPRCVFRMTDEHAGTAWRSASLELDAECCDLGGGVDRRGTLLVHPEGRCTEAIQVGASANDREFRTSGKCSRRKGRCVV